MSSLVNLTKSRCRDSSFTRLLPARVKPRLKLIQISTQRSSKKKPEHKTTSKTASKNNPIRIFLFITLWIFTQFPKGSVSRVFSEEFTTFAEFNDANKISKRESPPAENHKRCTACDITYPSAIQFLTGGGGSPSSPKEGYPIKSQMRESASCSTWVPPFWNGWGTPKMDQKPVEILWDEDEVPSPERTCNYWKWKYWAKVMGYPPPPPHPPFGPIEIP